MNLRLHNTLTGALEDLAPLAPPEVRIYACGPTVYSRAHIGNYRTFVCTDLLRRVLRFAGYTVREVMNITDVDDRIIDLAAKAGQDLKTFTEGHIASFEEDMRTLGNERPEVVPRATEHIEEMRDLIGRLIARGHTYTADGSVYFKIATFPDYGRLSRLDVAGIKAGARVDTDKYDKEDARDFVLWKLKADEPIWAQWDAPFGRGRPGWHIECSAMSMKYLGESFDVHCGGIDLVFPHHENEIAQSESATGRPFVKHWMHVHHLLIEGETMSKSKGNVFTVPEIVAKGYRPEAIRYLLLASHYRSTLNFTFEGLKQAETAIERVHGFATRLGEVDRPDPSPSAAGPAAERARAAFRAALFDDLNTPRALAAVHDLVSEGNALLAEGAVGVEGARGLRAALACMNDVFGVLLPASEDQLTVEEQTLLDERQEARRRRDFARADAARAALEARGVVLEDTPKGTRFKRRR